MNGNVGFTRAEQRVLPRFHVYNKQHTHLLMQFSNIQPAAFCPLLLITNQIEANEANNNLYKMVSCSSFSCCLADVHLTSSYILFSSKLTPPPQPYFMVYIILLYPPTLACISSDDLLFDWVIFSFMFRYSIYCPNADQSR